MRFSLMLSRSSAPSGSAQVSLSSRGILSLGGFGFGDFFNHWVSGAVFPRHFHVILEKLLLTLCQIFPMKWKVLKSFLLPEGSQKFES